MLVVAIKPQPFANDLVFAVEDAHVEGVAEKNGRYCHRQPANYRQPPQIFPQRQPPHGKRRL